MHGSIGRQSRNTTLALLGALLLTACADSGEADSANMANAGSPAGGSGRTDGTLTLGDRTYAFRVTACDVSDAEAESLDEIVRGIGRLADGTPFTVVADRAIAAGSPDHSVSLNYGNLMAGSGFMAVARRMKLPNGWTPVGGDPRNEDAPLIEVDGRTVRAVGTFDVDDAGTESVVEGRLEVTCPP